VVASIEPMKIVTHNWSNIFRDLVAAIVADALNDSEYSTYSYLLTNDLPALLNLVHASGKSGNTYWVCAFSVAQHNGICGENPNCDRDSLTGAVHTTCPCGRAKHFNMSSPARDDRKSIFCEMNKFDDVMSYLAAKDENFAQVIAADQSFDLFSRAWCVAETSEAFHKGMEQHLVVHSGKSLDLHQSKLMGLKVQHMQASRPEDVVEILSHIADKETFNQKLQELIFCQATGLLAQWRNLDRTQQMECVGRLARLQHICDKRASVGVLMYKEGRRSTMPQHMHGDC